MKRMLGIYLVARIRGGRVSRQFMRLFSSTTSELNRIEVSSTSRKDVQVDPQVQIHPSACVSDRSRIGSRTIVKNHAVIGDDVVIGEDCYIAEHVTVQNCEIGNRVVLKPGCRIGQDGFGFHPAGTHATNVQKKPQLLKVILEDDVEIGANSTVDRGSWRDTRIGAFTKLDNLVQVGHNVHIGKNCLIAAQSGIAGSSTIGDRVLMGGQSGVAQYVKIGDDSQIAAKSGVTKNLPAKSKVGGMPAVPITQFHRAFLLNQKRIVESREE